VIKTGTWRVRRGGLVTLSGGGKRRILVLGHCAGTWSPDDCGSTSPTRRSWWRTSPSRTATNGAHQAPCTTNIADMLVRRRRTVEGAIPTSRAASSGRSTPASSTIAAYARSDLAGALSAALAQYENRPVYITDDTFPRRPLRQRRGMSSISGPSGCPNSQFTTTAPSAGGPTPPQAARRAAVAAVPSTLAGPTTTCFIAGHRDGLQQRRARGGGAVFDRRGYRLGRADFKESHLHNDISGACRDFPWRLTTTSTGATESP